MAERPEAEPAEEVDRAAGRSVWRKRIRIRSSTTLNVRPRPYLVLPAVRGRWLTTSSVTLRPLPGGEDGDEPVHLAVEADAFQHPSAIGLERAAEVVQRHAGDPGHQPVGDPRGDLPAQRGRPADSSASPRRRRSPVRAFRAAGGCRPGRSGDRRPSARGSRLAPGRARPRGRRSGRSSARGTRPGRDRDRASWIASSSAGGAVDRAVIDEDQLVAERRAVAQDGVELAHAAARRCRPR